MKRAIEKPGNAIHSILISRLTEEVRNELGAISI